MKKNLIHNILLLLLVSNFCIFNNKSYANSNFELVPYNGNVEHIFFHPLIAYNSKAFDNDYKSKSMNDWFVTVKEFKSILNELYKNNFILVNINDVYEKTISNNITTFKRKELLLPPNKKPIIISIDDLNYYDYMTENGTVSKLILDENNEIATISIDNNGHEIFSYDNEIIPILTNFINTNPDFSHNNAKCIIALTGYDGILGYKTNRQISNRESEIQKVLPIVNKLKENGWIFANHSYGHRNIANISLEKLKDDTTKWKNEVENIIGSTNVYIYPYGSGLDANDSKLHYLKQEGYDIFCAVGPNSYENINVDCILTDRRHVDGITLKNQRYQFLDLYDCNLILDSIGRSTSN